MRIHRSRLRATIDRVGARRLMLFLAVVAGCLVVPVAVNALTSPRTWVDTPKENTTVTGDLVVTGAARHNRGVASVELVVKNLDAKTYWNGQSWQKRFVRVPVEVDSPGEKRSSWTFTLSEDEMSKGNFRARAFAKSVEGNGDAYGGDLNDFRYIPDLDPELYDTEIVSPMVGEALTGEVEVSGTAHSIAGVSEVKVAIQHRTNNHYWNADSQSWSASYVQSSATLDEVDGTDVNWSVAIPVEQSLPGQYSARAWVRTSTGKGDPFGRGRTSFTVAEDDPSPSTSIAPSPTTGPMPTTAPVPTTPAPSTIKPSPSTTTAPVAERIVWKDDFDSFDTSRWKPEHSTYGDGGNTLQCYLPENVSVEDGKLILQAVTETHTCPNGSTRAVTSGMVRSRGVSFGPGQAIEFRIKVNPADERNQGGLWPAVWSSGWAGSWPRGGEIDYFESMTARDAKRSVYSIHYEKPDGSRGINNKSVYGTENFSDRWHVVRFEYREGGHLVWILDGVKVHEVTDADTTQGYPAPFDQATNEIKINLALGGDPGPLDPRAVGSAGATFEMDYIKVVELGGGPSPSPTTSQTTTTLQTTTTTTFQTTTTSQTTGAPTTTPSTAPAPTTVPPTTIPPTSVPPTTVTPGCPDGDVSILLPCRGVLIGASGDFKTDNGAGQSKQDHFATMEARLNANFDIFHDFLQWNDMVNKDWPNLKTQALADDGRILLTNWKSPTGRVTDWAKIADGDYDADIRTAARQVRDFGQPTFITFYHEPEDNIRDAANGDGQKTQLYLDSYRDAFRHIVQVFEANGADNAVWVWDMQGWLGGFESYYLNGLYPGDDVVDWVAWNPYNWHGCENHGNPRKWKTFEEVVSPFYDWLDEGGEDRPSRDKPLMLGEWGSEENDGATNSEQTKAEWLDDARRILPTRFPRLKAVVYFDTEGRRTDGSVQFCEWAIDSSNASMSAMANLLNDRTLAAQW